MFKSLAESYKARNDAETFVRAQLRKIDAVAARHALIYGLR
jgi:hypothetical protein